MSDAIDAIERRAEALVESDVALLKSLIMLREKHNLSQAEVAIRMGVTQPTVSSFERYDSNPRLSTIRRYALAVDALVEHSVVDDCVDNSTSAFNAVVQGGQYIWSSAPSIKWKSPAISIAEHG